MTLARNRKFGDSPLEGNGFELPVPGFRSSIFHTAPEFWSCRRPRYRPAPRWCRRGAVAAPAGSSSRPRTRRRYNERAGTATLVALAVDEGFAGFALRLQRIEFLIEPLLG